MANVDSEKRPWDDDDRCYSSASHSDDSPILSYRYEKRRYAQYTSLTPPEERERRSAFSVLGKFCLFCAAMILFCVLMYIPVYNKANYHMPKGFVSGWPIETSRDTKIYVQPNNVTTIHEPNFVCRGPKSPKLLLLIIVCSATENYERRKAIRETWGDYKNYKKSLKLFNAVREKYKNYDYNIDLYPQETDKVITNITVNENFTYTENHSQAQHPKRNKRDISSFNQLLPALAKALNNISLSSSKTDEVPEKRFEDDNYAILPEFDMNKVIGQANEQTNTNNIADYDYEYDSNIMKIPPKGEDDEGNAPDLNKVLNLLKQSKDFDKIKHEIDDETDDANREFQLVFLLGQPAKENKTLQKKIEEEITDYGDIIQEGFIDSYNNLTLKSIMMLKWVTTHKCENSVRYILKTDDDTYMNLPNLMLNLRERARDWDKKSPGQQLQEYLLIGDMIVGARPVQNLQSKWYSPRYMYTGRMYPKYLSGMGYAMSMPTAHVLYEAALKTHFFHLEDVYITGMCVLFTRPRILPRDDPSFSYLEMHGSSLCRAHAQATAHRATPDDMRTLSRGLQNESEVDRCERIRLTQVRRERLRIKYKLKKGLKRT